MPSRFVKSYLWRSCVFERQPLGLDGNSITDWSKLKLLTKLKELSLRGCCDVLADFIKNLSPEAEKSLVRLNLSHNTLRPEDLSTLLLKVSHLHALDISETNTTSIYGISNLRRLRFLDMSRNPMEHLDPSNLPPLLQSLDLSYTSINEQSMRTLSVALKEGRLGTRGNLPPVRR